MLIFSVTLRFLFFSSDNGNLCREKARKEFFFPPSSGQGVRRGARSHCGGGKVREAEREADTGWGGRQ